MQTVRELLRGISNFPIPERTIELTALRRGLSLDDLVSMDIVTSKEYYLVEADLYKWLYLAANMSQGGQSYNFSTEERNYMRREANRLYALAGTDDTVNLAGPTYGYKGENL